MSKRAAASSKRLTQANLEALGAEKLAVLLMELGDSQAALKRRLRMELAAEVGPEDLAAEIDKRLTTLDTSRARVSWRKRAELILDLHVVRRMIAGKLGDMSPPLAMARLVAFLDLAESLAMRVKDPKGELAPVFQAAAEDLRDLGERSPPAGDHLVQQLADILLRARATWAAWLTTALPGLGQGFSAAVLAEIESARESRPNLKPSAQILRAVADAAGDVDAFIGTVPANLRQDPGTGAALATRLLAAGRPDAALEALRSSDPGARGGRFGLGRTEADGPAIEAWQAAYVEVLEAAGQTEEAQAERWASFEQTLSADALRAYLKRLPDFDDVIAADKAFALAAGFPRFEAGLAFLMEWPAHSEAAAMVLARRSEIGSDPQQLAAWAERLEGRYPLAALMLLRGAITLAMKDRKAAAAALPWVEEAQALASRIDLKDAETHEAFAGRLTAKRAPLWRG